MERFQYAYGWLTNWSKSNAYLIAPEAGKQYPDKITFQSVLVGRGVDPLTVTEHTISLIKDNIDFFQTKVDNPSARFNELKDFIKAFQFHVLLSPPGNPCRLHGIHGIRGLTCGLHGLCIKSTDFTKR
jgi:hypothetical protein